MKVLVCGGRDFDDWGALCSTLDKQLSKNSDLFTVIQGGAIGADFLARVWAKWRNCPVEDYPADWRKYGKSAGPLRNQRMIDEGKPDLVVAFPGGVGTADMISRAKAHNIPVLYASV